MYLIRGLCHRSDISMGQHGFVIDLSPKWKEAVKQASFLNAEKIGRLIEHMGGEWLDACGYSGMFDPDNCGFDADKSLPPGPNARRLYEPRDAIRVSWGEWGPEHISVPGNACGLDIDKSYSSPFRDGRTLTPHNIDCWRQKYLLLIVFTTIAEHVAAESRKGRDAQ